MHFWRAPNHRLPKQLKIIPISGGGNMNSQQVSIASIIERRPLGAFRLRIFLVCFLIVLMDGFDTQAIGFAAKAMSASLDIPIAVFGKVFSAGLLGAMLGAFILGPMADRFGRRWTLFVAILVFSVFTLLTAHTSNLNELLLCRLLAGLGLGGAIPNLLALSSEYTPRRMRGFLTGVLYAAFPVGGMIGALISAQLVPLYGWHILFLGGGLVPLVLAAIVALFLPESLQFLLRRQDGQLKVQAIVDRIAPGVVDRHSVFIDTDDVIVGIPARQLFANKRLATTLLLWGGFFMCFVLLITLVLWTPALLRGAGIPESRAALIVGLVNFGSIIGTAVGGRLVDRFGPLTVLPILFICGAISVSPLGYVTDSFVLLGISAALSGCFMGAGSSGLLSLAVLIYPSAMRATGVGWAMAMGRMGQVTGPLIVGALLASGISINHIFLYCAIPALFATTFIILMRFCHAAARTGSEENQSAAATLRSPAALNVQ
jgi:AAHS family 4-hydroxybenzoate transporter-like MFS transporter